MRSGTEARPRPRAFLFAFTLLVAAASALTGCATAPSTSAGPSASPRPSGLATVAVPSRPASAVVQTPVATPTVAPVARRSFSVRRVIADTRAIAAFGVRVSGSTTEQAAATYAAGRLRSLGYKVKVEKFKVPGGVSRNLTVVIEGEDSRRLVLGGHLDTRSTTPGANDNALGCAMVIEMARIFAKEKPPVSLELTLFGAEEYNDGTPRDHHRGSRYHVAHMTKAQLRDTLGMISIDVVGYGRNLYTRTMDIGPLTLSDFLIERGSRLGIKVRYLKDPGVTGWSDHEPYEKAGVPAVWLERLQDPQYHKAGDTAAHLQSSDVRQAGLLLVDAIRNMGPADIATLASR